MNKNNKVLKIVLIIVGIIVVCLFSFFASLDASNKNSSSSSSSNSSEDVSAIIERAQSESDAVKDEEKKEFISIDVSKYLELLSGSDNSLVLIARPTCSYCQIAEPIIQNIAYKYDIDINYLNTDEFEDDDEAKLVSSHEYFSEGYGTPILLIVSNGDIVDKVDGLTDTENYIKFFTSYGFINE